MKKYNFFKKTIVFTAIILISNLITVNGQDNNPPESVPLDKPLTIKQSLDLAGQNMLSMLEVDRNYLPCFRITVRLGDYKANMAYWWPAHNIGRWWDASLRMEESLGYKIPPAIEKAMTENTKSFFENPDKIMINPNTEPFACDVTEERYLWDIHSVREGMLALTGLAKQRNSAWAKEMGRQMALSLNSKLRDDGTWDMAAFDATKKRGFGVIHNANPCDTHGRMLEALVWFYEATGVKEVKEFADRVALWHFNNTTLPNGEINPVSKADHTHSYLGTLRGLYLYGRLTNKPEYIQRVVDAYRVNIPKIVKPSGYTSHNMAAESFGETTSPGDVAQLALWLYLGGYADFLDDAERLVRAHILPSQIRSTPKLTPFLFPHTDPISNMYYNLDQRVIGAYGGCTVYPNGGKVSTLDVTAADVHSLVDIYDHIVISDKDMLKVLFHFDYENDSIKIQTKENLDKRTIVLTLKQKSALSVRIPHWVPQQSVRFTISGKPGKPVIKNSLALFKSMPKGTTITLQYDLPKKITTETNFGQKYTIYWRGDNIVGMSPNREFYPFHPNAPTNW